MFERSEVMTDPMTEVRSAVGSVRTALAGLPEGDLPGDGSAVAVLITEVVVAQRQLAELQLRLSLVAEVQAEAAKVAASGTDAWLAALTGSTRAAQAGGLWLARLLGESGTEGGKYAAVRVAFARGDLAQPQARVILGAAEQVPEGLVADDDLADCVSGLVERAVAEGLDPTRLRRVARRMLGRLDPELADRHQAALLEEEERKAEVWFTLRETPRGDYEGRFTIPALHADLLRTALEHLSTPRRLSRNRDGDLVTDDSAPHAPSWQAAQGAALCELIEHLPRDGWSTGARLASVMIHLDHAHLVDELGAAHLDTGTDISAREARRLACDTGIIPAVFGTASLPLDLGRERRLFSPAQHAALSATHDTCAAEGCQRPFAWTELHHLDWWSRGGPTDLANALPLCAWHHHRIHDPAYSHRVLPSGEVRYRWRRHQLGPPDRQAA